MLPKNNLSLLKPSGKKQEIKYKIYGYVALSAEFDHWRDKHGNKCYPVRLEFERPCIVRIIKEDGTSEERELSPNEWRSRGLEKADAPRDEKDEVIVLRKKWAREVKTDELYVKPKPAEIPSKDQIKDLLEKEDRAVLGANKHHPKIDDAGFTLTAEEIKKAAEGIDKNGSDGVFVDSN